MVHNRNSVDRVMSTWTLLLFVLVFSGCRQPSSAMSEGRARRLVRQLRVRTAATLDPNSEGGIHTAIQDLGKKSEFVEVDGTPASRSTIALWKLRAMGEMSIPFLLDALAGTATLDARRNALKAIAYIHEDANANDEQYLAVYVLAAADPKADIRATGVAQIAEMARRVRAQRGPRDAEHLVPYLRNALLDSDDRTQLAGAAGLWHIGRKDLVPAELVQKFRLDTVHYD